MGAVSARAAQQVARARAVHAGAKQRGEEELRRRREDLLRRLDRAEGSRRERTEARLGGLTGVSLGELGALGCRVCVLPRRTACVPATSPCGRPGPALGSSLPAAYSLVLLLRTRDADAPA